MNLIALISAGAISGFFMPLFSHIPILNALTFFPCGWMWISGILAVALYRWLLEPREPLTRSVGAIIGIFTGVVAAFTSLILAIFLGANSPLQTIPTIIVPIFSLVERTFGVATPPPSSFMFLFLMNLTFYPAVSAFGGFVCVAIIGKSGSREKLYSNE